MGPLRATPMRATRTPAAAVALLCLVIAAAGCGGGGGGGGGGTQPPTAPQPSITFTAGSATAPAVRLGRGAGSGSSVLELEVRADALTGVYGLAFDLTFPAGLLRYDGFAEGGFLGGDGAGASVQVAAVGSGRLVVGCTRLGTVGTVSGSGVVVTLRFTAVGAGAGGFSFSRAAVLDASADEVGGVSWAGGTVSTTL